MRKWSILMSALLMSVSLAGAAEYTLDKTHAAVQFKVRHLVSKVSGQFKDFDLKLAYDPAKPEAAKVEATIQTKSVDTANEQRDAHLRGPDFFNVDKFPTMIYKSRSVKRVAPTKLRMEGDLTMLGVTKPVALDVEEGGVAKDPWGNTKAGFLASGKLNRKDFGMVWNKALDSGGMILGDDVEIIIEIEATQK